MIVSLLSWAVVAAAFFQPTKARGRAAKCFVIPLSAAEIYHPYLSGEFYYISCALLAALIVFMLAECRPFTRISLELQLVCIASIALNAIGWALYKFKFQPDLYDWSFITLYAVTLAIMLKKGGFRDVGSFRMGRGRVNLCCYNLSMCNHLSENQR